QVWDVAINVAVGRVASVVARAAVEAIKLAIADFGGTVHDVGIQPGEVIDVADHDVVAGGACYRGTRQARESRRQSDRQGLELHCSPLQWLFEIQTPGSSYPGRSKTDH